MAERKSIIPFIGSLDFRNSTDKCEIPNSAIPASAFQSGFVLFGWINPRSVGGTAGRIFDKSTATNGSGGFFLAITSANLVQVSTAGSAARSSANNSVPFNRNTHFVSEVLTNGRVTHYINGVLSGTPATSGALSGITTTNPLTIGNRSTATDRAFDGRMAQLGILSLAGRGPLTQEEINALYLHNAIPQGAKILHLETTAHSIVGDQWLDKSGNNNHATIEGATFSYDAPTKRIAQIGAPKFLKGEFDGTVSGGVTIADGAMVLNGTTGFIDVGNIGRTINSVGIWLMATDATSQSIIDLNGTATITTDSSDNIVANNFTTPSIFVDNISATGLTNGVLHFVQITTGTSITVSDLDIGRIASGYFGGSIVSLHLHNRVLSAEERTAIFNAGPNAKCPITRGLVAEYSGRDYVGTPAAPTRIFDVASWSGRNVL
jgi:hypothetical protein